MGQFFMALWTSLDSPWNIQAVQMADCISLSVRMGHFHVLMGPILTVHGPLSEDLTFSTDKADHISLSVRMGLFSMA